MADRRSFVRARNTALTERESGRNELYRQILATPVESRWKIDPAIYSRLSPDQLRRVLSDGTGDVALPAPSAVQNASSAPTDQLNVGTYREPGALRRFWRGQRISLRAAVVGVGVGMVGVAVTGLRGPVSALVMPPTAVSRDANHWPACHRLDQNVDACVYVVQVRLSWVQASQMLGIQLDALKALNKHLSGFDPMERGTVLMVWRNRLTLE